jgi:hypothetical protein
VLRVSVAAESAGVPTASIVSEGFVGLAKTSSMGLAMPDLGIAMLPSHPDVQSDEELERNVLAVTLPQVIERLTQMQQAAGIVGEPEARAVAFEGTFDEVNRYFYENLWTDGLPIVPPTRERIDAFLEFTDRDPEEVLGTMLPDNRQATIWSIAVNGAMAGCRPEYMPILVALAEAMADPQYGVEHSGNTPGSETQIVIDGPIIKELGFNYEQGALRDGFQANTSIGRFWRLYLVNVAGFQRHLNDKATFGGTWRVVMAENEDVLAELGWSTLCADLGLPPGGNAVSVARYTGGHVLASVYGKSAEECLPYLADALKNFTSWELVFTVGLSTGTYRPLLVLSPIIAKTIAKSGVGKAEIQQYLFEHARITAEQFEKYIGSYSNLVPGRKKLSDLASLGKAPKVFGASRDPQRLVPVVARPQDIMIAVSGEPLRTNCYFFSHNGFIGFPTAKPVRLPPDWKGKLAAARR